MKILRRINWWFLTTPHALMRGIPHPHGLGFLLRSQSQRPNSAGLTSHLSDGTVLQIQKPVTNNSLTNKMKNIKRNKCLTSPLLKQGALRHKEVIVSVLILAGLYAIWYAIYLFVKLIERAMFGGI